MFGIGGFFVGTLTHYEKKLLVMKGRPISIETPNCILSSELEGQKMDTDVE